MLTTIAVVALSQGVADPIFGLRDIQHTAYTGGEGPVFEAFIVGPTVMSCPASVATDPRSERPVSGALATLGSR